MSGIQFEDAVKPDKITRVENPYTEIVAALAGTEDAKAFTVDAPKGCKKGEEDLAVLKARRQLTDAGNAAGVTVRTLYADAGKGKVKITFWTVSKIKRNPKDESVTTPVAAPKPVAKKTATRRTK